MNDNGLIVHEWIAPSGGSENVLEAMSNTFPTADIFCLWNDSERIDPSRVIESPLAKTPLRRSKALALPFMPRVWRNTPTEGYEWLLVSSHLFAHQVGHGTSGAPRKFVYVHTPARYIWAPELDERGSSFAARLAAPYYRKLDRRTARSSDAFLASNSEFVKERVQRSWGLDSIVIPPPVDVQSIQQTREWASHVRREDHAILESLPSEFVLGASRFVSYKKLDDVIRVGEASDIPVVLAGAGPDEPRLRNIANEAKVPVTFVPGPSSELLYALYQRAVAYVFPPVEDFGIMPVEAMATGTPVIVNHIGGATESVLDGVTGAYVDFASVDSLSTALSSVRGLDASSARARAREFDTNVFASRIVAWIEDGLA